MSLWFTESGSDGHRLNWRIKRMLFSGKSSFQSIEVLDTETFGPSLVLDGIMQTTSGDEFIYHEMLAWVPLRAHPRPHHVLIIGGGDGGLAREVLTSKVVKTVTLVEIDPMVVEIAKAHLPHHVEAFADPRLTLVYADGLEYLSRSEIPSYDLILVDSTDPEGAGPGNALYTPEFHRRVFEALAEDGLYIQQTGAPIYNPNVLHDTALSASRAFPLCRVFWCVVPTYPGGFFTFTSGSKRYDLMQFRQEPVEHARWYSPAVHRSAFALPPIFGDLVPESVRQAQAQDPS